VSPFSDDAESDLVSKVKAQAVESDNLCTGIC
jgi:hypothetical protein